MVAALADMAQKMWITGYAKARICCVVRNAYGALTGVDAGYIDGLISKCYS